MFSFDSGRYRQWISDKLKPFETSSPSKTVLFDEN